MGSILSSEILESQFGPTQIRVVTQTQKHRIIVTEVISTGQVLELSYVTFNAVPTNFESLHARVVAGESMGTVYKSAEVEFTRLTNGTWVAELPKQYQKIFKSNNKGTVVDVAITLGGSDAVYARILETYSPLVIWHEAPDPRLPQDIANKLHEIAQHIS